MKRKIDLLSWLENKGVNTTNPRLTEQYQKKFKEAEKTVRKLNTSPFKQCKTHTKKRNRSALSVSPTKH